MAVPRGQSDRNRALQSTEIFAWEMELPLLSVEREGMVEANNVLFVNNKKNKNRLKVDGIRADDSGSGTVRMMDSLLIDSSSSIV